jgi:hypothetical protein
MARRWVVALALTAAALLPTRGAGPAVLSMPLGHRVYRGAASGLSAARGGEPAIPTPIRRRRPTLPTTGHARPSAAAEREQEEGRRALQGARPLSPHPDALGVQASEANGYAYYATVHLGDPPVAIGVDLDTGSASLAVPSSFCENCAVDIEAYNPARSTSSDAMACDDALHCENNALLWSPDCVSDTNSESSPDMGEDVLRTWKTHQPGWVAPTFRRVRLLFDHGSCASAAAISGVFTLDGAEPTIAGQPHYTQEVCAGDKASANAAQRNCTTYHLQYSEEFAESNWPWVVALRGSADAGSGDESEPQEASDDSDVQHLARFAADMDGDRAGLTLGEAVLAQCVHQSQLPAADFQSSSLAVRAYKPFGPPACCAEHSHACLHSDYYKDGSGTTGPVYSDKVRVGGVETGATTHAYFKAFEDDEGGVASGGHFTSSHSGAGIWGLAPVEKTWGKTSGVRDMGSVLGSLLADNGLADAFALCFDDSPAAFSDGDDEAASSIDLGGPDRRKYSGSMRYLQMISSDSYVISTPQHIFVGGGVEEDIDAIADVAAGELKSVFIDSGTAKTLSLPRVIERALAATVLAWFRAEYDLSSGAAATAANVAQQLFTEGSTGCISLTAHATQTVALFPTLDLVFADTLGESVHIRLPPTSYLEIWPDYHAMCLLIDGESDESTAILAAGFLRRYYTLFDRENSLIGVAERGDCTPDEIEAPSAVGGTAARHCAARTSGGCASCAGPVDDLELDRGYCIWCPSTATCNAYDPRALSSPCVDAQGYDHASLDAAPGGHCPEFTVLETSCQAAYNKVTDLAMRGNVPGACSAPAQQAINTFAAACEATTVRMHQRGKTVALPGSACVLSVLADSTSVHGMDECSIPSPLDPANQGCNGADNAALCAYDKDGACDAGSYCPDGSDLRDCYGSSTTTSCPANSHASSVGCICDSGFVINSDMSGCDRAGTGAPEDEDGEASEDPGAPNSCWSANDGECDAQSCPPGTDTADCDRVAGGTDHVPSSIDCPHGWVYDPVLTTCDMAPAAGACPTVGDGVCDEPQRCPVGSDEADCRAQQGLGQWEGECPVNSHATAGHTCTCDHGFTAVAGLCEADPADCGEGVERLNDSCPPPPPALGFTTPSSCPGECESVFIPWWTKCAQDEAIFASFGEAGMASLLDFYSMCRAASGGVGGGH